MTTPIELQKLYKKILNTIDFTENEDEDPQTFKSQIKKQLHQLPQELSQRLSAEFFSWGPIESLLNDEAVTEILINGPETIYYEKAGEFYIHEEQFLSCQSYEQFIYRFCKVSQILFNLNQPCGDGHWQNFRVHLIAPPLCDKFIKLSLRRHPKKAWTFNDLQSLSWATDESIEFLKKVILQQANILFVGPTGSGKTSVINACLQMVKPFERTIIIEESDELVCPNEISLKLCPREDINGELKGFDQSELIRQALRMRPHRLVLGEVRSVEAKDLMLALSTGHKGSFGSLHANNARQALWRLEMLVQMGAPQWSLATIRSLLALSLDYVVTLEIKNGKRQLQAIHRLASVENNGLTLEKIN